MEFLILGILALILSLVFVIKVILCTIKDDKKGIVKNFLFMLNFGIYSGLFISLYQTPNYADLLKALLLTLILFDVSILTIVTITLKMRNK